VQRGGFALFYGPPGGIEFGVADQVRNAVGDTRVVGQILIDPRGVVGFDRAQVAHERDHRIGIVARPRHKHEAVLVGLRLISPGDLGHRAGREQLAERRQQGLKERADAKENLGDRCLVLRGHGVPAFDVARFVSEHTGQLVIGLDEVQRAFVHIDVSAQGRERVDVADV
jgi:hypothetical protein